MSHWIKNNGIKPNLFFVDLRFDNCVSTDSALQEKTCSGVHVDEFEWDIDKNGSEITHYRESVRV